MSSHLSSNRTAGVPHAASPILSHDPAIVVVGAGCVGLACAMQLLQAGYENVHVVTKETTPMTTSDAAGALWRPFGEVSEANRAVFARWGKETFDFLNELRLRHGSERTGICLVSGYEVFATEQPEPFWKDDVIGFRTLGRAELKAAGLDAEFGFFYTSIIVDMAYYLQWMHRELRRLGGRVHLRELSCLSELHSMFPRLTLVVNASGLGSGKLVKDEAMFPVAGHIVKVKCPSVHHFYMDSENTSYVFPRLHDLVCGGTYFKGQASQSANICTRNDILTRVSKMVPDLERAQIVGEYVGLRPYREVTRLEIEYPSCHALAKNQTLLATHPVSTKVQVPVIHNYGHGGSGVTLHWGCATTVMELAKPVIGAPTKPASPAIPSKL